MPSARRCCSSFRSRPTSPAISSCSIRRWRQALVAAGAPRHDHRCGGRRRPGACRGLRYRARPVAANMGSTCCSARSSRKRDRLRAFLDQIRDRRGAVRRAVRRIRLPSARKRRHHRGRRLAAAAISTGRLCLALLAKAQATAKGSAVDILPAACSRHAEIDDPELRLRKLRDSLPDQESGEGWQPRSLAKVAVKTALASHFPGFSAAFAATAEAVRAAADRLALFRHAAGHLRGAHRRRLADSPLRGAEERPRLPRFQRSDHPHGSAAVAPGCRPMGALQARPGHRPHPDRRGAGHQPGPVAGGQAIWPTSSSPGRARARSGGARCLRSATRSSRSIPSRVPIQPRSPKAATPSPAGSALPASRSSGCA